MWRFGFLKKMFLLSVVLPGMNSEGKRTEFNPLSEHDGLIERYKSKNLDGVLEVCPFRASFISSAANKAYEMKTHLYILMRQGTRMSRNEIFLFRFIIRPRCGMTRLRAMSSTSTAASPRPRSRTSRSSTTPTWSTSSCSSAEWPRTSSPWTTGRS